MFPKEHWRPVILLYVAAFLAAYLALPQGVFRLVLLFFFVIGNLFFAPAWPSSVFVTNALGILLFVAAAAPGGWLAGVGFVVLAAGTAVIPGRFFRLLREEYREFDRRRGVLLRSLEQTKSRCDESDARRRGLEKEIEKISRLYLLGRELVEHVKFEEISGHLQRALLAQPGVISASLFSLQKNGFKLFFAAPRAEEEKWTRFVSGQAALHRETKPRILPLPPGGDFETVLFVPLKPGGEISFVVMLSVAKERAHECMDQVAIFTAPVALGLRRSQLFAEVEERSRIDGLTGLYLRRYFLDRFQNEIQRARRYSIPFSLIMLDIDHFKNVNDTHGHLAGDRVLARLSAVLRNSVSPGDLVGRYGGEEFIVLLPLVTRQQALETAEKIRRNVAEQEFTADGASFRTSVSIGVGHYPDDGATPEDLLSAADKSLYWVKTHGRNGIKQYREIYPA